TGTVKIEANIKKSCLTFLTKERLISQFTRNCCTLQKSISFVRS
ncbi:LOW QUALITY PROTEIN: hypothetical protein Smp_028450, partial [Schistosoma mansoni]